MGTCTGWTMTRLLLSRLTRISNPRMSYSFRESAGSVWMGRWRTGITDPGGASAWTRSLWLGGLMQIRHDYSQYRALRKSPGVARFIDEKARAVQQAAQANGRGTYVVESGAPGTADRWRAYVATGDTEARRDQAKNDTLQKALGAGRS